MTTFVSHYGEYMGEAPRFVVEEYPTQLAFLRELLLDDDSEEDIAEEDIEYQEYYNDVMALTEEELIERIEDGNGDGQPFLMVINLDTKQTIIGNLDDSEEF